MTDRKATVPDKRAGWFAEERDFAARGIETPTRPNIVFIFADDLGWGDLSSYGSLHNDTPHIDRLGKEGVRFTHGYSASATCSPTRIGFYTGRYPGRLPAGLEEPLTNRTETNGIPHEHPTIASLLRDGGYRTAMFGKWHCGWLPWFSPLKAGFDEFFGNLDGALDYFSHIDTRGEPDLWEGEVPVEEVGYYTELVSRRAAEYIRESGPEPFYLQVNYTAPHWPWEGPQDEATSTKITEAAKAGGVDALIALFHFEGGSLEVYRNIVAALDEGVGVVLDALDDAGLADNTIVVFSSDNGGERYAFLWPFVGEKGDLEEGGIRVPNLVRWPAAIGGSQVSDLPVSTLDWTATLLDAAGVRPDPGYPLDGASLVPWLVQGDPPPTRDLLWRTRQQGAVRRGRHKLIIDRKDKGVWHGLFAGDGPSYRLYDVTVDGREKANLATRHPDLVAELTAVWERFEAEQLPYPPPPRRGLADGSAD
ncbi:MAG TPA: sulfatase-like hydrolase/transferase [Arachnia sp.]|nr:sulfatase-like hydrolase/transferase [Arachnia sp.]HMT87061.1 sulfatase-like hydrolase/transferase [Arachnia sp.]